MISLILIFATLFAGQTKEEPIQCEGRHRQGFALICKTEAHAGIRFGDATTRADALGWVVIGHDRDAPPSTVLSVETNHLMYTTTIHVEQRKYNVQRIEGLEKRFIEPTKKALERIRREANTKAEAYKSLWQEIGFANGFIMPVDGVLTGVYGSQRFYNGHAGRPHYGIDIASPAGSPVIAPASGIVTLANDNMYYEGGLIFIDHGQGLTSAFLHLSEIYVREGDVVEKADMIGSVGSSGRSTGAHLDWRVKWRNRFIDPLSLIRLNTQSFR